MEDRGGESKARVVRCLNCQNLLPELADISLHRCGGCGVTLQAKGSSPRLEPSSNKLAGTEVKYPETSKRTSENKAMVSDAILEPDLGTNPDETGRQEETAPLSIVSESEDNITSRKKNCLKVDDACKSGKAIVETISHEGKETEQLVDRSFYAQQAVVRDAKNDWNPRAFGKGVQLASYLDEGPSNYRHQNRKGAFADVDFDKKQNLAPIRMELLRMLDELRDQLQKTCEVSNKHVGSTASSSSYTHHVHANTFPGASFPFNRNLSSRTSRELERNASKLASFSNVPFQSRQFSGVARGHQTTLGHQGSYLTNNSESPHLASPLILGSRSYNSKLRSAPSTSLEPQVHRRALFGKHAERLCHSFAGGAPFVICNHCFELLELPGKSLLLNKKMNKLRCGACSKLISVYCNGRRNVASALLLDTANYSPVDYDQHANERLVLPSVATSSDHGKGHAV